MEILETLAFQGLVGLNRAMYLWLIASGLTIVFGVLGILNFAHGSLFMLGAYFAFTFYGLLGINFWLSILLSLIGVALIGLIMERFFLRHIYHLDVPYQLLLTFGFILIFDDAVKWKWGTVFIIPPMPDFFTGAITLFARPFPIYNLFTIAAGIGVAVGLWLILEGTWWGRIIRASASDREMASAIGVNIPILFTTVFMFGAALAAFGGAVSTPVRGAAPGIGATIIIEAFVVTVIGGLGNLKGAFVGAIIVGVLTAYGILLFPIFERFIIFVVMAIVLLLKPEGLFGE